MPNLQTLIDTYLQHCDIERGFAKETLKGKKQVLNHLLRYLSGSELTLASVRSYMHYLHDLGWKNSAIRTNTKSMLKPFVKWLANEEHITENWGIKLILPQPEPKIYPVVSLEIMDKIIKKGTKVGKGDNINSKIIKKEHRDALFFIARTGIRIGAVINLKKEDVDILNESYRVYSKGKCLFLPIPKDLIQNLFKRSRGLGKVFNVNQQCLNRYVRRGCNILGISKEFTVHTMRHSFCTGMLNLENMDISIVSRLMGHSSIKVTSDVYANYNIEDKRRALNRNPQIRNKLSIQEVFGNFEKDINLQQYRKDNRFIIEKQIFKDRVTVSLIRNS